ncbi:MAG: hypothetical protein K6U11_02540 [bacterium]|nr:hypothetical protein [bacterium]
MRKKHTEIKTLPTSYLSMGNNLLSSLQNNSQQDVVCNFSIGNSIIEDRMMGYLSDEGLF